MTAADQEHRARARLRLDANVVVEAGAGTGKTTLLVDRILFLLLGRPVPVTGVVALTFTDKAAGEIKLRLADRLVEIVSALSGAAASARAEEFLAQVRQSFGRQDAQILADARQALERLDRSPIGTIHSFAAQLLRLYPLESGVDPGFRVDEGDAFEELFASEWAAWLDVELGERAPRAAQWREVLRLASLDDLEDLARALSAEGADLDRAGRPDVEVAARLEALARRLDKAPEGQPAPKGNSRVLESLKEHAARLRELARAARQQEPGVYRAAAGSALKASSWPKGWNAAEAPAYEEAVEIAKEASPESEALLRRACALARPFAAAFRETYARRGLVSFDGLLRRARDLVQGHPQVREKLKRDFPALLIDEFQDTDPLQGELLLYLAEAEGRSASRWEDVVLGPGRLFVVGDPKQSIYRFRGADIAAYQRFTEAVLAQPGALHCDLTSNFRSPVELLGPVNAIFKTLMRPEKGLQASYKALTSGRASSGGAAVDLVAFDSPDAQRLSAQARQKAEAAWIGSWILDNCGPGKLWRYKDVAVLLRTSTPLAALLEAFKARGVPYAVEMERFFYGAQEVIDFLNLLKALDDPQDALSLAALLRSPLVALEDAHLYTLARGGNLEYLKPKLDGLPAAARRRASDFFDVLRGLRERVGRRPLGELIAAVLDETALLEVSARAYHGEQTVANLSKFARMAAAASDEKGMTLGEFIERVSADRNEARNEGENPLADEHLEAVRVMTVHKSKGLEFPVVFLANASAGRGGGDAPLRLQDWASGRVGLRLRRAGAADAAMAALSFDESTRQERETVRLLYVALTRAKERLFVLGGREGDKNSLSGLLASAGAWPSGDGPAGPIRLDSHLVQARSVPAAPEGPAPALKVRRAASDLPAAADVGRRWKRRQESFGRARLLSWTLRPTDGVEPPKERREPRDEPGYSAARSGVGVLIGQLCHAVLECWDFSAAGDLDAALERARLKCARLQPGADWSGAGAQAREILGSFFASRAARALAKAEILGREIPFAYGQDGAVMRGAIDLLYRLEGRLVVADYKTEAVQGKNPAELQRKYERQGRAYVEAVRRAWGETDVEFRLIFLRAADAV